jgi:hydrogenase maturation protease
MVVAPILIFAIGNESRGDDALAPLLVRRLADWLVLNELVETCEILEEYQLQVEHIIDLQDRQRILFIDAGMNTPVPFNFYPLKMSAAPQLYSHALTPDTLLAVHQNIYPDIPLAAFVLCIKGESFELGEGLSAQAEKHLLQAFDFTCQLLKESEHAAWSSG